MIVATFSEEIFTEEEYLNWRRTIPWQRCPEVRTFVLKVKDNEQNAVVNAFIFNPTTNPKFNEEGLTEEDYHFFARTFDWTPFSHIPYLDVPLHENTGHQEAEMRNPFYEPSIPDLSPERFLENSDIYLKELEELKNSIFGAEIFEEDMENQLNRAAAFAECSICELKNFVTTVNPYYVRSD